MNLKRIGSYFVFCGSTYWILSLPFSPIYVFVILGLFLFFISTRDTLNIGLPKLTLIILLYLFYILTSIKLNDSQVSPSINQAFSLSYFFLCYLVLQNIKTPRLVDFSYSIIFAALPILIIESIYRLLNPMFVTAYNVDYRDTDSPFYAYKLNSLLNQDSNYVSVLILILLFFSIYLATKKKIFFPYLQLSLIILLILTLSRASILIFVFCLLLMIIKRKVSPWFFNISSILIISIFVYKFYVFSLTDLSTQIKLASFIRTETILSNSSFYFKLFGAGIGNSAGILGGVSAHNILEALILEQGYIGLFLFFFLQYKIDKLANGKTRIIMIPFLLVSMSFFVYAITYYYAILSVIVLIEKNEKF